MQLVRIGRQPVDPRSLSTVTASRSTCSLSRRRRHSGSGHRGYHAHSGNNRFAGQDSSGIENQHFQARYVIGKPNLTLSDKGSSTPERPGISDGSREGNGELDGRQLIPIPSPQLRLPMGFAPRCLGLAARKDSPAPALGPYGLRAPASSFCTELTLGSLDSGASNSDRKA